MKYLIKRRGTFFSILLLLSVGHIALSQKTSSIQFVENKNQWPKEIAFGAVVNGGNMFIRRGGFSYYFLDQKKLEKLHEATHIPRNESMMGAMNELVAGQMIQVDFKNANVAAESNPFGKLSSYYNYFVGNDPKGWASKVSAYEGISYSDFYDGVDLNIYSYGDAVKYDLIVHPGADASQIRMEYAGTQQLFVSNGDLQVEASFVKIIEQQPIAFQIVNGKRVKVACEYDLVENILTFCFPHGYDPCLELVIDPLLIFSTYSGSQADNWGSSATPGENGKLYSSGVTNQFVGNTFSGTFPATPGAFQTTYGGVYDVAILKYDSIGQHLLYATYLGGSASESPHSLVMNSKNELIVLGTTGSTSFPTTASAIDRTFNGGTAEVNTIFYDIGSDIFVSKISQDGSQLLSSTFLGGTSNDGLNPSASVLSANYGDQLRGDILTDSQGNIYISSVTSSIDFPVKNSFGLVYQGGATDALILKLNSDLSQIMWGSFLGGAAADASHTIKIDQTGALYVAGGTASTNFPTTTGAYQTLQAGSSDGWIARITNDGSALSSSTLTGTSAFDQVYFLDLNSTGEVYVYGQTAGSFPVTTGVYHNVNSGQFIQKFSTDLKTLLFSTVFGSGRGIPDISPTAFLVNSCNNIYMSGWGGYVNTATGHWQGSNTLGMPLTADAYQQSTSGSDFYFMVLTADAKELLYATYLGGSKSRTHVDGGTSRFDKGGIVYHAVCAGCVSGNPTNGPSSDFPTTSSAWSRTNNSRNCNNAAFKFDLSSLRARIQTNSVNLKSPGISKVCLTDKIVFKNLSTGGQFFEWKLGDGTNLTRTDTSAIVHQYLKPGQYIVRLKAIDAGTCIGKDSTSTIVSVNKPQGYAGPDQTICKDVSTHLIAGGGGTYDWKDSKGAFKSTAATPLINPEDTTRYFITIIDVNGCVKKDTVDIKVVPGIDLKFTASQIYDCNSRPQVKVVSQTDPKEGKVYFDFGDGTTSEQKEEIHSYHADGTFVVRIVGKRATCIYDKQLPLPFFTLFVPNVITPGGSAGLNDFFKIKYGDKYISEAGIKVSMIVYNRWGGKVYENSDYKDNWGAEGLAAGTYYYELKIEDETTCKGWVEVVR